MAKGPIDFASSYQIQTRVQTASAALTLYEYVTTIDQEVSTIWKRRLSATSFLLISIRWAMVTQAIVTFAPAGETAHACASANDFAAAVYLVLTLSTAAFSALRVYAIWGASGGVVLAGVVFVLGSAQFATNMYVAIHSYYEALPGVGCDQITNFDLSTYIILVRVAHTCSICADALVVAVTWLRSLGQLQRARRLGVPVPLASVLFRDGTAYFLILLGINILALSTKLSQIGEAVASFSGDMPPILINRFLLNLRQLSEPEASEHVRTISAPMFRMTIDVTGNMGESLDHGWEVDGSDEAERAQAWDYEEREVPSESITESSRKDC